MILYDPLLFLRKSILCVAVLLEQSTREHYYEFKLRMIFL